MTTSNVWVVFSPYGIHMFCLDEEEADEEIRLWGREAKLKKKCLESFISQHGVDYGTP